MYPQHMLNGTATLPDGKTYTYNELKDAVLAGTVNGIILPNNAILLEGDYSVGIDGRLCQPGQEPRHGSCDASRRWKCGFEAPKPREPGLDGTLPPA